MLTAGWPWLGRPAGQLRGSDSEHPVSGDDEYAEVVLKFFRPAHRNYLASVAGLQKATCAD